jgi:hypothetical protein
MNDGSFIFYARNQRERKEKVAAPFASSRVFAPLRETGQ